ncbi:hypothetical protein EUTSA_v10022314mg [Eutrema salsugineum]|uniref:FKB95-like N-terminal Kelch domain-containing protein n=1 Tax=Eutrema salsugineum TaxID=72664 RepID=V4LUL4_EUTSA|nr:hypothetical protein EUTSA_v10022314mg [Eutrema salsugineum]
MSSLTVKKEGSSPPTSNPSLPDDLLKELHRTRVKLYKARSLLGKDESCLYLCLGSHYDTHWFTLCRKPDKTLINNDTSLEKKSSEYVLARVPILHYPPAYFSCLVAVGSDIYNIGCKTRYDLKPSSSVSVMDCRSHTWHEAPSIPVELTSLSARGIDGKIYVAGRHGYSLMCYNIFEVLETETKTWDPELPLPCCDTSCSFHHSRSACIDGKFHVAAERKFCGGVSAVAYDSMEGKWDWVAIRKRRDLFSDCYCEIEDVLYCVSEGAIRWYDTKAEEWRDLMGLVGLPKLPSCDFIILADYGGKLAVLWENNLPSSSQRMIWCAEIMLARRISYEIWDNSFEICGKVEWFDHVLTVPKEYALAATV